MTPDDDLNPDDLAGDGDELIGPLDPDPQPPPIIPEGGEAAS